MAEEISWEIRGDAYNYYVTDGLTYEQVAQRTGVSLSQLKRWGQAESWVEDRRKYRESQQSIKRDTVKLRAGLLKKALESQDAQDVYAFAALERIEAARKSGTVDPAPVSPEILRDIRTPQEVLKAMWDVVEIKLNRLLTDPGAMDAKSINGEINGIKSTLDLIEQMKQKYAPEEEQDGPKTLDAEAIRNIREQLRL